MRFISPDTIVPEPGNPQALNRYSYTLNNPLKYTDPTGHNPACAMAMGGGPLGVIAALACEVWFAVASVGPQVQALAVNYGPQVTQGIQQAGNQIPALVDQLHQATSGASSAPGASPASSGSGTSGSSGLDPNDPFFRRLIHQTGESDPIRAVAKASVEGPAKTGARNGVTVLGRYPAYKNTALRIDGNYLNFVDDSWDRLTDAQRWAVNKQFLDDAIARGDTFRLASLVDDAKAGTYFRKELEYLISLGYQVVGDVLVKVK